MPRPVTGTAVLLAARRRVATLENTSRGLAHPRSSASSVRSGVGAIVILGSTEYWLDIFLRHPTSLSNPSLKIIVHALWDRMESQRVTRWSFDACI